MAGLAGDADLKGRVSEENYVGALRHFVDAQAALPLTRLWGDGTTSSSDGQFFRSDRRGAAGSVNVHYGSETGQKIYTQVADTYLWQRR